MLPSVVVGRTFHNPNQYAVKSVALKMGSEEDSDHLRSVGSGAPLFALTLFAAAVGGYPMHSLAIEPGSINSDVAVKQIDGRQDVKRPFTTAVGTFVTSEVEGRAPFDSVDLKPTDEYGTVLDEEDVVVAPIASQSTDGAQTKIVEDDASGRPTPDVDEPTDEYGTFFEKENVDASTTSEGTDDAQIVKNDDDDTSTEPTRVEAIEEKETVDDTMFLDKAAEEPEQEATSVSENNANTADAGKTEGDTRTIQNDASTDENKVDPKPEEEIVDDALSWYIDKAAEEPESPKTTSISEYDGGAVVRDNTEEEEDSNSIGDDANTDENVDSKPEQMKHEHAPQPEIKPFDYQKAADELFADDNAATPNVAGGQEAAAPIVDLSEPDPVIEGLSFKLFDGRKAQNP